MNSSDYFFKNLTIENVNIQGYNYCGAFFGGAVTTGDYTVDNLHLTGTININGRFSFVGGIAGDVRGNMSNCTVDADGTGTIHGYYNVGGIAGYIGTTAQSGTTVTGSSVQDVAVSAYYDYNVGAIAGFANDVVISNNTVSAVAVSATAIQYSEMGILVGASSATDDKYLVVADNTVVSSTASANGTPVTTQVGSATTEHAIVGSNVAFDESGKVTAGIFENIPESAIASGYLATDNPDTTTSADYPLTIGGPYVAKIGDTPYATLADAVAAVPENGTETTTITMIANTELAAKVVIPASKNIVLDLNGKTITTAYNGDPSDGKHYYAIGNYGTFTLNDSSVELNGGTLLSSAGSKYAVHIEAATVAVNDITVSGSNWNGVFYTVDSNLTVEDADIDIICAYYVFYVDKGSTVTVNGGTYKKTGTNWESMICVGTEPSATVNTNTLTINDGTFELAPPADKQGVNPLILQWVDGGYARIVINGGTIIGTSQNLYKLHSGLQNSPEYAEVYITAGTFYTGKGVTAEVPSGTSATIAPGSVLSEQLTDGNGKTYYTVVPPNYVAQVISLDGATTNKYENLMEAINVAYNGGTVELLTDVTVDHWHQNIWTLADGYAEYPDGRLREPTAGPNGLTINGNGHSLTINGSDSGKNGNQIFAGSRNLTVSNITINAASGVSGIGLKSGTISNVTFNMAGPSNPIAAIHTVGSVGCEEGEHIEILNCTFNTSASDLYAIVSHDEGDDVGTIISGNTFNTHRSVVLRSDMQFLNNTVNGAKGVTIDSGSTAVVRGNYFADTTTSRSINVYPSNATIENNVILGPIELEDDKTYEVAPDLLYTPGLILPHRMARCSHSPIRWPMWRRSVRRSTRHLRRRLRLQARATRLRFCRI